jgi:hypothetical protein
MHFPHAEMCQEASVPLRHCAEMRGRPRSEVQECEEEARSPPSRCTREGVSFFQQERNGVESVGSAGPTVVGRRDRPSANLHILKQE